MSNINLKFEIGTTIEEKCLYLTQGVMSEHTPDDYSSESTLPALANYHHDRSNVNNVSINHDRNDPINFETGELIYKFPSYAEM